MADIDFPTYAATTEGSDAITAVTGPLYATAAQGALADSALQSNAVDSVNTQTGAVVLDADDIDDTATTNKFATAAQLSAVDALGTASTAATADFATAAQGALADSASQATGVENNADVTDATNVAAAGAVMALSTVTKINGPITQAAYDLLTPDADTLYVIVNP